MHARYCSTVVPGSFFFFSLLWFLLPGSACEWSTSKLILHTVQWVTQNELLGNNQFVHALVLQ